MLNCDCIYEIGQVSSIKDTYNLAHVTYIHPLSAKQRHTKSHEYYANWVGDWIEWRLNGKLHRLQGKPAIIDASAQQGHQPGKRYWYQHGKLIKTVLGA